MIRWDSNFFRRDRVRFVLYTFALLLLAVLCFVPWRFTMSTSLPRFGNEDFSMPAGGLIDESFKTHLPLVVIDTNGRRIRSSTVWSKEQHRFIPYDGSLTKCSVSIYNGSHQNSFADVPDITLQGRIRLRGNSSLAFDKKQYLLKLTDEQGNSVRKNLLGMGEEDEWVLNTSLIDKSLMRNHLAYSVADEIMSYTPDSRYCEVVFKEGETYLYNGVYLLMENIKRGNDRVNFVKYSQNRAECGYIVRRDRYDEGGVTLNTYATQNGLAPEYIGVKSPSKSKITEQTTAFIEEDISRIERVLYSDDPKIFLTYPQYIDVASFVDYFIINEFFGNYDAGFHSTYFYKELGGKLHAGPVWDFDRAMDNDYLTELKTDSTAFHEAPWFNQLLKDPEFTRLLVNRYAQLRKGVLSEERIFRRIDETADFLGAAARRDWARWGYFYTEPYLEGVNGQERNAYTYEAELDRIKAALNEHGVWLDDNIDSLYQFTKEQVLEYQQRQQTPDYAAGNMLAVMFVIIFMVSTILVRRS